MKIQQLNSNNTSPSHKGVLDGAITTTLRTLDTNPMANAVGIDLFSMVAPRTYVDTKERNKYAGAETFFREFTGTIIVCLSASYLAKGIAKIANKIIDPSTPINPNSWFSKDSITTMKSAWDSSHNKTSQFVENILDNTAGLDGGTTKQYKNIDWQNVQWIDEKRWNKINWENKKYNYIHERLKTKEAISETITELIENKNITKNDRKNLLNILSTRVTNALGANSITVRNGNNTHSTSIPNLLRDTVDIGKDIFTNTKINQQKAIDKLVKINKIKALGALSIASTLGLTNQYINRKITEKRTGTKGFVGDKDYKNNIKQKTSTKDTSKKFIGEKLLASAGMVAMALGVMRVKSAKDFVKKLEFTGPVTSGNAIKTVYGATLVGRFMASDNKDELRETATRDYLGFLNWLVLGGFAAKGVANILDPKHKILFNESKSGKGIKHWLNDLTLKSHNEIASKGTKFAQKNMWKLNLAQASGLAYSTIALGYLLPKLNIFITGKKQAKSNTTKTENNIKSSTNFTGDKFYNLNQFKSLSSKA